MGRVEATEWIIGLLRLQKCLNAFIEATEMLMANAEATKMLSLYLAEIDRFDYYIRRGSSLHVNDRCSSSPLFFYVAVHLFFTAKADPVLIGTIFTKDNMIQFKQAARV